MQNLGQIATESRKTLAMPSTPLAILQNTRRKNTLFRLDVGCPKSPLFLKYPEPEN